MSFFLDVVLPRYFFLVTPLARSISLFTHHTTQPLHRLSLIHLPSARKRRTFTIPRNPIRGAVLVAAHDFEPSD
jgi:hypothetical protein